MGVQRYVLRSGVVRYRARVKFHGREVATRVFERKADATAWEQDQRRRLRLGEWTDPRRGRVPLSDVAADWLNSRGLVKRRTKMAAGLPDMRVHDLRHTAASLWLAAGADPKVVQRILGHATAAMTMDLYVNTW